MLGPAKTLAVLRMRTEGLERLVLEMTAGARKRPVPVSSVA